MKKTIIIESIIIFFLVILILSHLIGFTWFKREMFQSCQPSEITYDSYGPYCISLEWKQQTLGGRYIISVTKQGEPDYGYFIHSPYLTKVELKIQKPNVQWTQEGVEMEMSEGDTKVFIPKQNFIGTR